MKAQLFRRIAAVVFLAPLAVLMAALPASAHVTVHPNTLPAGSSYSVLTFRVPNETDDARTVKLQVFLPTDTPLIGILVRPVAGWHVQLRTKKLAKPYQTDDGPLTTAVDEITWSGGSIPVGGYQDFDISVGHFPDHPGDVTFKALQTYSDGTVVRWIETAPSGSPEPDHPAPILQLTAATPPSADVSADESHEGRNIAIVALAASVLALWIAVAGRFSRPG